MGDDLAPTAERDANDAFAGRDYGETLWQPSPQSAARTVVSEFVSWLAAHGGPAIAAPDGVPSYRDLWRWSVDEPAGFWTSIWDFFGVLGTRGAGPVLDGEMPAVTWFDGSTLNYARNALHRAAAEPDRVAVRYSSGSRPQRSPELRRAAP